MNNERKIKEGDTVRLKSGGPIMTVGRQYISGFQCAWFDEKLNMQVGRFPITNLEKTQKNLHEKK